MASKTLSTGEFLVLPASGFKTTASGAGIAVPASGGGGITGTFSATESGADTTSISGTVAVSGDFAATESGTETTSISGAVAVSGDMAATESGTDSFAATGGAVSSITGTFSATESGTDATSISGAVAVSGSMAATESGSDFFSTPSSFTYQASSRRIGLNINLPPVTSPTFLYQLYALFRQIISQVNNLSDGAVSASYSATSAPSTGTHATGDFVKNSKPTETGTTGSKYIVVGWICTTAGTPGTWQESRTLTGN